MGVLTEVGIRGSKREALCCLVAVGGCCELNLFVLGIWPLYINVIVVFSGSSVVGV